MDRGASPFIGDGSPSLLLHKQKRERGDLPTGWRGFPIETGWRGGSPPTVFMLKRLARGWRRVGVGQAVQIGMRGKAGDRRKTKGGAFAARLLAEPFAGFFPSRKKESSGSKLFSNAK
ncbi:hypothetical protein Taro_013376 [Colocasia esculenta]|uniref:Uncharacterized protein n=1 Tax=Colocasia esculenta TaxID=4460 RepID=A0A843UBD1_COLES|nr:hypothetical protein [Colocasia esculenta]